MKVASGYAGVARLFEFLRTESSMSFMKSFSFFLLMTPEPDMHRQTARSVDWRRSHWMMLDDDSSIQYQVGLHHTRSLDQRLTD